MCRRQYSGSRLIKKLIIQLFYLKDNDLVLDKISEICGKQEILSAYQALPDSETNQLINLKVFYNLLSDCHKAIIMKPAFPVP